MHKQISILAIGLAGIFILSGSMGIITYATWNLAGIAAKIRAFFALAFRSMEVGADPD